MRRPPPVFVALVALASVATVTSVTSCADSEPPTEHALEPEATPDAAVVVPVVESCEGGAFCRVELPPSPVSLNGIWGSGPDDVWIVGSPSMTIHWNGTLFVRAAIDARQPLLGVWGSGKGDVWTFGTSRTMWHSQAFEPATGGWSRSSETTGMNDGGSPTPILAMWGASASDVWAVGASLAGGDGVEALPTVLHCDGWSDGAPRWQVSGTTFGDAPGPERISFNAVCGNPSSGVWIVGNGGKTRYTAGWKGDGASWTPVNSQSSRNLHAVWCGPDADVWATGEGGLMHRFTRGDGGEYAELTVDIPTTRTLRALWGSAADDLWAVGDGGTVLHWDGKAWTLVDVASAGGLTEENDLFAIWGSSKDDVWIAGRNVLLHNSTVVLQGKVQ